MMCPRLYMEWRYIVCLMGRVPGLGAALQHSTGWIARDHLQQEQTLTLPGAFAYILYTGDGKLVEPFARMAEPVKLWSFNWCLHEKSTCDIYLAWEVDRLRLSVQGVMQAVVRELRRLSQSHGLLVMATKCGIYSSNPSDTADW